MTAPTRHVIRFSRSASGRWLCSCGAFSYGLTSAEVHAHAVGGRIETAGAPTAKAGA